MPSGEGATAPGSAICALAEPAPSSVAEQVASVARVKSRRIVADGKTIVEKTVEKTAVAGAVDIGKPNPPQTRLGRRAKALSRREHHDHLPAFHGRLELDLGHGRGLRLDPRSRR